MRKMLILFSLFAICLCLSCFTTEAVAFTSTNSFQNEALRGGGLHFQRLIAFEAFFRVGVTFNSIKEDGGQIACLSPQCIDSCHKQMLKQVIDVAVRSKKDGTWRNGLMGGGIEGIEGIEGDPDFLFFYNVASISDDGSGIRSTA